MASWFTSLTGTWTSSGFPVVFIRFYKNCNSNLSEFSTIDTTILVLGALFAGNYFGGEVENLALQLRDATQWSDAIKLVEIKSFTLYLLLCLEMRPIQGYILASTEIQEL